MKIAIAGASGLVGSALTPSLTNDGAAVTRLVRSAPQPGEIEWHPNQVEVRIESLGTNETNAPEKTGSVEDQFPSEFPRSQ